MDGRQEDFQNIHIPKVIQIRGAKVHNLKNINVDVPLNQIVGIFRFRKIFPGSGRPLCRRLPPLPGVPFHLYPAKDDPGL